MTVQEDREADLIEVLLPRFQADGYDVYVHPSPSILPPFMRSYRPDAIALKSDKKIAIEVIRSADAGSKDVRDLQSLFADQSDWELRVIYAPPLSSKSDLAVASRPLILDTIRRVEELRAAGNRLPALVMAWSTFEAIGRALLPARLGRPQTPARLVEVLASDGIVTPEEAEVLRRASAIRNVVAHGGIDAVVDDQLLGEVIAILMTLAEIEPAKA
uniref:REase AHJR-like domain-containing protein n=1 Tax=Rhodopseudomonas palustris (strain BisA53) TaxID=316055 RepID=Q07I63_RHOP5